jgi:membrane protein required for colicin V production
MALAPVDYVVLGILALALLRGLVRGLLREAFSIASVAAAVVVVKLFYGDVAEWLLRLTQGGIGETAAPWAAGAMLAIATMGVITLSGRFLRRGARVAGLGWADRAGGALLGGAEGVLVAGILIGVIGYVAGRDHPSIAQSRSLEALEELEQIASTGELPEIPLPAVAAPAPPKQAREATLDPTLR